MEVLYADDLILMAVSEYEMCEYRVAKKICHHNFLYVLTLPNISRFSKLFHCENREKICNNTFTITKDHTTPQMCQCEMSVS